ncbi:PAS domain S-box-containing protein [Fontimonas thermophila]|uniref:PAS domain S-box-containing protein n=1 Tax=Fontimonas thermophila TaxID=1076937 RepID=A0A1I2IMD9_9GAMM|nr:PAS domain S-box-containing protein [Fontimonas thermophila]
MVATAESIRKERAAHAAPSHIALVVAASESVAKRIESYLRNAGHPVRCPWATDLEDVEDALRGGTPDLLICAEGLQTAPIKDVIETVRRQMPDLPVLVLKAQFTPEDRVAALACGASDQVSDEDLRHLRHLELVVLREITQHSRLRELRSLRKRLAEFEARHQQLLAGTQDAVAHIQEGILSDVNPAFAQLLGYTQPDLQSVPLMDLVAPDHQPKVKEYLKLLLRGKNEGKPLECCLLHKDGRRVAIHARVTLTAVEGEPLIEMLIRSETPSTVHTVAGTAPAMKGRLEFFEALASAIAAASQQKDQRAALLCVVNDFTATEERLGLHDAAEAVEQLQNWLQDRLAPQDQLFRFSTHEIALLLSRNSGAEIIEFGETLAREVGKQIFNTAGHEVQLAVTVAAYPFVGSEDAATLTAELVRDTRKLSGKGGSQFANLGPTAKTSLQEREEARKAEMVKKALEDNRLKLAYQSIASLEGDTRQHFDILVRLIDENGKELHASEFIGAAEKFSLIKAIDRWVTARALKIQAKRDTAQQASSLFVKLSQDTLKDAESFIPWLGEQLKQRPLRPGEIVFEMQELVVQNHIRKTRLLTKALIEMGAQIAIEHFGIGSNSAQMIEHIPMHFVKFHPSFTANFNDKETHRKMVELMESAKNKQIKIIVSHVEEANVMARLWQMGVNFIQGYHVQEPEVVLLSADVRM